MGPLAKRFAIARIVSAWCERGSMAARCHTNRDGGLGLPEGGESPADQWLLDAIQIETTALAWRRRGPQDWDQWLLDALQIETASSRSRLATTRRRSTDARCHTNRDIAGPRLCSYSLSLDQWLLDAIQIETEVRRLAIAEARTGSMAARCHTNRDRATDLSLYFPLREGSMAARCHTNRDGTPSPVAVEDRSAIGGGPDVDSDRRLRARGSQSRVDLRSEARRECRRSVMGG